MLIHAMLGARVTILMYHSISRSVDPYSVTPETFQRHVEFIKNRYEIVALKDIDRHLRARGPRRVIFTFDDAFTDFLETAHPILQHYDVPSTVFVPTGHVGGWNAWDRRMTRVIRKNIMTAEQLCALAQDERVEIGSHSVDHFSMGTLGEDEMRRQAVESRHFLETLLNKPVTSFAYPYGGITDHSPQTERALQEAGYERAVTTRWGSRNFPREVFKLRRISFLERNDLRAVQARIEGWYDVMDLRDRVRFRYRRLRKRLRSIGR